MNKRTKYAVFGYIRNVQTVLVSYHGNNNFYNIPDLVIFQCLLYYYTMEYVYNKQYFQVDELSNIITKTGSRQRSHWDTIIFGPWMNSMDDIKSTLKIKVIKLESLWMYVGLVADDRHLYDTHRSIYAMCGYAYQADGRVYYNQRIKEKERADEYKTNDTVSVTLEMKSGSMSYIVNNSNETGSKSGKLFGESSLNGSIIEKAPNMRYKWAISMSKYGNSCQIINIL